MIAATNNESKLREIRAILNEYKIYSLKDRNIAVEVEEDQDTFLGNAKNWCAFSKISGSGFARLTFSKEITVSNS